MAENVLKGSAHDIKEILRRIKNRDFSGNSGLAIKNSIYQFSTNFAIKIGSLIFTVIIARLLMPELFGLYNLALSTILIFFMVSNMGIGQALVRFVSREIGKKNFVKARSYVFYIWKVKALLIAFSAIVLLVLAKFISETYYQKPIFWALVAGSVYILFYGLATFLEYVLQASNYFNRIFHKEMLFQIFRVVIVPIAVILAVKGSLSDEAVLSVLFLALAFSYLLISLFMVFFQIKTIWFMSSRKKDLSGREKKVTNRFLIALSATALSGLFFEYVDKVMLGHFVQSEFIGYYSVAISIVGAFIAIEGFGTALLPIFSRAKKKALERGLKKSLMIVFIFSFLTALVLFILAPYLVSIIYGSVYLQSITALRLLSLLLIPLPLIAIYSSYFISVGRPKLLAKYLIISTLLNILLNYILITSLLKYGGIAAILGAGAATIISEFFYLVALVIEK